MVIPKHCKIICRDCRKPFKSKSALTLLCDGCKKIIKTKYYHDHKESLRLNAKRKRDEEKSVTQVRKSLISDDEQKRINAMIDNMYVTVDRGRSIPRGSREFEQIAADLLRRESRRVGF